MPDESPSAADSPPSTESSWPISGMILGLYVVTFFGFELYFGGMHHQVLFRMGMNQGEAVAAGDWQRPILATWLHLNREHLTGNLFGLLLLSLGVEWTLGAAPACLIMLTGSICGFLAEGLLAPGVFGFGASSGVWALCGACFTIGLLERDPLRQTTAWAGVILGLLFVGQEAFFLWDPQASLIGHFTGLATGLVSGAVLAQLPRESLAVRWVLRVAAGLALSLPILAALTLWPRTTPWAWSTPDAGRDVLAEGETFDLVAPLPDSLFAASTQWVDDAGRLHLTAGLPDRDAMTVSIYAAAGEPPWQATPEEHEIQRTPPREVMIGDQKLQFYDIVSKTDPKIEFPRWIGVQNGVCFDLRVSLAANASPAWRAVAAALPGQIQIELRQQE